MKFERDIEDFESLGDNHIGTSSDTPLRDDAFKLTKEEKIDIIKDDVRHIMETLGLDLTDDSLKGTPNRVAKMFVNEIFGGDPLVFWGFTAATGGLNNIHEVCFSYKVRSTYLRQFSQKPLTRQATKK